MSQYPSDYYRNPVYTMTLKQLVKQALVEIKEDWARKNTRKNAH